MMVAATQQYQQQSVLGAGQINLTQLIQPLAPMQASYQLTSASATPQLALTQDAFKSPATTTAHRQRMEGPAEGTLTKMTEALDISQSPLVKESPPMEESPQPEEYADDMDNPDAGEDYDAE